MNPNLKITTIYLMLIACVGFLVFRHYQDLKNAHLELSRASQEAAIQSANNTYKLLADTIFSEIINTDKVLSLLRDVKHSHGEEQNIKRGLLYRELAPVYTRLREKHLRQLHFHFPDGRSLLRMHAPDKSGDSLVGIRTSVEIANSELREVHSYESGRILHGFRHVYPIIYNNEHLGSVEISTSFFHLLEEFQDLETANKTSLQFILYKPELWHKLFPELHPFYQPATLHPNYVSERADLISGQCRENISTLPLIEEIKDKLLQQYNLQNILAQKQSCSVTVNYNYTTYSVIFHSIENTIGEHAAYLVGITPEPLIAGLHANALLRFSLFAFLLTAFYILWLRYSALQTKQNQHAAFLQNISDNMGIGLYTADRKGFVTYVNSAALKMLETSKEEILGQDAHKLFHVNPENPDHCLCDKVLEEKVTLHSNRQIFTTRHARHFPVEVVCSPLFSHNRLTGTTTVFQDITERLQQEENLKKAQEELRKMALQDSLTGVLNRRGFDQRAEKIWRNALRRKQPLSLLMIDIDHFKLYNDHYGHKQGDRCLERVAKTLDLACKRPEDIVARYGGEEFIALLPDTDLYSSKHVAKRMLAMITELKLKHAASPVSALVTVSIGCCGIIPDTDKTLEELVVCADRNLYQAKNSGRNRVCASEFTQT
ncbi:MAG: diguanylate cyclase [Desulfuromonadaceae bacterium]